MPVITDYHPRKDTPGRIMTRQHGRPKHVPVVSHNVIFLRSGICHMPHQALKYGTRPFLGGSGRKTVANTRPVVPKMPRAPSAFPQRGVPPVPDDKLSTSKEG